MQSIKTKALFLLSRRSYFTKELEKKLLEKGYPSSDIAPLLQEFQSQGWLDDEELASCFVKLQREKGYGARIILQKLRQKAGPIEIEIEDGDLDALIERKFRRKLPRGRDKVVAALLRRGFSYDLINKALAHIREY